MQFLIDQISKNRTRCLFAVAAGLLILSWHLLATRYHTVTGQDWRKVAAELGSVPQFRRERYIIANHANTCVIYNQDVETGVGFFFCNITSGKKSFLTERIKRNGLETYPYGWSPDDSLLIYCTLIKNTQQQEFVICDGKTGTKLDELQVDAGLGGLVWLSSHSFAYGSGANLVVIEQRSDGKWIKRKTFHGVLTSASCLTAISENSVAWQMLNAAKGVPSIFQLDLNSGSVKTIWKSPTNELLEFTYSSKRQEFLLNCRDENGQYLIRCNPSTGETADGGRVFNGTDGWIPNITWGDDSPQYAYLSKDGLGYFEIKADGCANLVQLPWHGGVTQYFLYGDCLFVTGNPENEFPGVWRYNVKNKLLDCIALESLDQYLYAKRVPPIPALTTNLSGQEVGYYLWPPAKVTPGKKYPIIFSQTVNEWLPYQEAAANAGYYFVIARRSGFHNDRMQNWSDDVMSVYKTLLNQPNINIDTNQMYLWGRCGETGGMSQLLNSNPALWKGLIIFDPAGMPNIDVLHQKRVFVITGREANGDIGLSAQALMDYQANALTMGVPIKLILQDHIGHFSMSVATERARTVWFTEFLLQAK